MKKSVFILFLLLTGCFVHAQVSGCTDPLSTNYNSLATKNDGSCRYVSASVHPVSTIQLPDEVKETSGLIVYNNTLYTHNDDSDINLYALDSISGTVIHTLPVTGAANQDWEEIAQDEDYFYIGDFGNNVSGNRTNLNILKVGKQSLLQGDPQVEHISFSYSGQTDFSQKNNNSTDFDCEAMVVSQDSIYLFTKQWISKKTSLYVLPKTSGNYVANLKATYDVSGLITGATYLEDKKLVVLSGYNSFVSPFFYLLYDFQGHDFFSGNKRKVAMSGMSFHQTEGIATQNGFSYFVSNEHLARQPFVNVVQKLHHFDLSQFLGNYLENFTLTAIQNEIRSLIRIYPNPARDIVYIDTDPSLKGLQYTFLDISGKVVLKGMVTANTYRIDTSKLATGIYTIQLENYPGYSYKLIKK
ncbi:T9SS type A sorting domain-containing protein [Flavobacterium hauense]